MDEAQDAFSIDIIPRSASSLLSAAGWVRVETGNQVENETARFRKHSGQIHTMGKTGAKRPSRKKGPSAWEEATSIVSEHDGALSKPHFEIALPRCTSAVAMLRRCSAATLGTESQEESGCESGSNTEIAP